MATINASQAMVLVSRQNGIVVIPSTPLTRLNYFDGKFLRAQDLKLEQDYLRQLVRHSNQASGPGVAHGFDLTSGTGDTLNVGEGLAIDPQGRVLLLPQAITVNVQELIDKSLNVQRALGKQTAFEGSEFDECELKSDEPAIDLTPNANLFLIVVSSAEALCGEEDVFGKLCEEACATSTDRPYVMEGITLRAIPLALRTPLPNSRARSLVQLHLRSRIASAYFADERRRVASLISRLGLQQQTWCLGADAAGGNGVAIGVIARAGSTTIFLDPWIARRELMDTPAKRYWQWRMMMRPWDVFMAQVLQFQCQLRDLFRRMPETDDDDPCDGARSVLQEAATTVADFRRLYESTAQRLIALRLNPEEEMRFEGGLPRLTALNDKLFRVGRELAERPQDELLIRGGIIELPSAGYLPVVPGLRETINQQVRRFMGNGVDLRFCVVRPDYVAHALEEAQHMERISLLQGLDNPEDKPQVDILVPNGEIIEQKRLSEGMGFEASVDVNPLVLTAGASGTGTSQQNNISFKGAARAEKLASSGGAFYLSGEFRQTFRTVNTGEVVGTPGSEIAVPAAPALISGLWMSLRCDGNVFTSRRGDTTNFNARAIVSLSTAKTPVLDVELNGVFQVVEETTATGTTEVVKGRIENAQLSVMGLGTSGTRRNTLVDLDASIQLKDRSQIAILLHHAEMDLQLSARWANQPLEVRAAIIRKSPRDFNAALLDVLLADAVLKENADVLSATNDSHVKALSALRVVAGTLSDPNFADAKARLLFPPPPKPIDDLLVRGTMDWVLFHRRRTKQCQVDVAPPPPPPPPRRFALWMGVAADARAATAAGEALASNRPMDPNTIFFTRVDVLEFEPGLATMISRPSDVDADWKLTNPGREIVHIAIASATANDGEAVARDRTVRVVKAVSPTSQPGAQTTTGIHSTVHAELAVPGTDGFIALITLRPVASVCHSVYRARNADRFAAVVNALRGMTGGNIADVILRTELISLGDVLFQERTGTVFGDGQSLQTVDNAWAANQGGRVAQAAVVFQSSPPDNPSRTDQALAIAERLNDAPVPATALTTITVPAALAMPTACPAFTILQPEERLQTVCMSVFRTDNDSAFNNAVRTLRTLAPGANIEASVIRRNELQLIDSPQFEENTTTVVGNSMNVLLEKWRALPGGGGRVLEIAVVHRNDVVAPERTGIVEQADRIRTNIGMDADAQATMVPIDRSMTFPTPCRAFVIILASRQ